MGRRTGPLSWPLRVGESAVRRSTVLSRGITTGRSGTLTFVRVGHTVLQRGEVAVEERQDIFSALTYNAHRIHYDRDYATGIEGYPGHVTHGPLQAIVMAEAARAAGVLTRPGLTCEYRLVAPLFEHQGLIARAEETSGRSPCRRARLVRPPDGGSNLHRPARSRLPP